MKIVAQFALERETTNSARYKHNGGDKMSSTVYISKSALPDKLPMNVTITVETEDA